MKKFGLAALAALLVAVLGFELVGRPPSWSADLIFAFPASFAGPVHAPTQPFSSYATSPYLGMGWKDPGGLDFRQTLGQRGSDLRLYLSELTSVELTLEGRLVPPSQQPGLEMQVWLHQAVWCQLKLTPEWRQFRLMIPARQLREGNNPLRIQGSQPTQWRLYRATAANIGRTFADTLTPAAQIEGTELRLPFGQSVAYPIQLNPRCWLTLDNLESWLEPGSPPLAQASQLVVRIRSGDPAVDRSWRLSGSGPQQIHLQTATSGAAQLSLLALSPSAPVPGQIGLRLVKPRLDSWRSQPHEEPQEADRNQPQAAQQPNVIVSLIDTLRADHLGCYGYAAKTSPCIDGFSRDSVLFAQCTAQSGWTKPATASILTSQLARQHGAMDFGDQLHPNAPLLSQILQQAGYETRAVVTNPFVSKAFGFERGFDHFELLSLATSGRVNQTVLPWLHSRKSQRPFFLYVHTLDPHLPYGDKFSESDAYRLQTLCQQGEYWGRTDPKLKGDLQAAIRAYDQEIVANDASFGRLLEALKQRGHYDNTLIVVVSDHGEEFLDHGRVGHNNSLYQELLHVPLIIKFPGSRGAGTRVGNCWQQIDIAPTILASAGLKAPKAMVGKAYWPGTEGDPQRPAYISIKSGVDAARWGQGNFPRLLDVDAVRQQNWIMTHTLANVDGRLEPRQLFDLAADPGQRSNQFWTRPEIAVRLNAMLPGQQKSLSPSSQLPERDVQSILRSLQYLR